MTNEVLNIDIHKIRVSPSIVEFNEYESLKQQAQELALNIEQVEVTEENIQVSKKMLAAVNKRVKEMEDKRVAIKKEILRPYHDFESQVKDIVSIVKTADDKVRQQVKALEEQERHEKETTIRELFDKRMKQYDFDELFGFDDFIKPQHLNKSTSFNSVELDMVTWFEQKDNDLNVIKSLPNADKVLTEYLDTKDLSTAMRIVNEREQRVEQAAKVVVKSEQKQFTITVFDEKDLKMLELFMMSNDIKFKL